MLVLARQSGVVLLSEIKPLAGNSNLLGAENIGYLIPGYCPVYCHGKTPYCLRTSESQDIVPILH